MRCGLERTPSGDSIDGVEGLGGVAGLGEDVCGAVGAIGGAEGPVEESGAEGCGGVSELAGGSEVGGLHYCILLFDENDICEDVEFHGVGASTTEKPFESESEESES